MSTYFSTFPHFIPLFTTPATQHTSDIKVCQVFRVILAIFRYRAYQYLHPLIPLTISHLSGAIWLRLVIQPANETLIAVFRFNNSGVWYKESMDKLAEGKCVPCEGGVPPLKGKRLEEWKAQLDTEAPGWELKDTKHLQKEFKFKDFKTALEFVDKVGAIAESEGHHPNIEFGWGFAKILLWTHAIDGLSENDFFLAAKIDKTTLTNEGDS